jgi:hypothetical protein
MLIFIYLFPLDCCPKRFGTTSPFLANVTNKITPPTIGINTIQ